MKKLKEFFNEDTSVRDVIVVILTLFFLVGLAFLLCCVEAQIAMRLWNWLLVDKFGFAGLELSNIWEMWGIILLCNILFKNHINLNNNTED